MFNVGDVISYIDMCKEEGVNLQRGMNFQLRSGISVILMSLRPGAPYSDRIEENGKILIYEGHDIFQSKDGPNPKTVDQPFRNPSGSLTQNGLFFEAAKAANQGTKEPEVVRVYEKIKSGIWVYNGLFKLIDAWEEINDNRKVFKFKLEILDKIFFTKNEKDLEMDHKRLIPTWVKLEVWRRDKGRCVTCGSEDNLHFDHIIPYSKGGSSLVPQNIQLLCARHNIEKKDRIL
jgi:hypothetical protein